MHGEHDGYSYWYMSIYCINQDCIIKLTWILYHYCVVHDLAWLASCSYGLLHKGIWLLVLQYRHIWLAGVEVLSSICESSRTGSWCYNGSFPNDILMVSESLYHKTHTRKGSIYSTVYLYTWEWLSGCLSDEWWQRMDGASSRKIGWLSHAQNTRSRVKQS